MEQINDINISKVEQEISGILMQGDDITANLITLLKAKQTEIDGLNRLVKATEVNLETLQNRVIELDAYLNEHWEDLDGLNRDLAEIFKLEIEQETEVTFTITGTATIKHSRGIDLEDMDMSELIDCDILTRDYTYEVQDYDISDISGN
jgi:hypothetical protein